MEVLLISIRKWAVLDAAVKAPKNIKWKINFGLENGVEGILDAYLGAF